MLLNVYQLVQPLDDPCLRGPLVLLLRERRYRKDEYFEGGRGVRDTTMFIFRSGAGGSRATLPGHNIDLPRPHQLSGLVTCQGTSPTTMYASDRCFIAA
jgi:hypothetical protein